MNTTPDNTSRLRDDIDSGRTGDKVPFPDPAASPLGTDDEAAGTPPSAAAVRQAARTENAGNSLKAPNVSDERQRTIGGETRGRSVLGLLVPLAIIGGIAVLAVVVGILLV